MLLTLSKEIVFLWLDNALCESCGQPMCERDDIYELQFAAQNGYLRYAFLHAFQ